MLTRADDFPIHQTPEPIAFSGTDRNFYDRYFFNGYSPDGRIFFAAAFGIYPHLNIADAHFAVVIDGIEHCLHASRFLHMERMDLTVGPITIKIIEPLKILQLIIADHDGISAELIFTGRAFPIEEPRFTHRIGPRVFMDYTRLTQNGHWQGQISIDGRVTHLPAGALGTRDRSWGVRPIGAGDTQPFAPPIIPGFFWQWVPLNFAGDSVFFHINADSTGQAWNTRAVLCPDGAGPNSKGLGGGSHTDTANLTLNLAPDARIAKSAVLDLGALGHSITLTPIATFLMRGIGYVGSAWPHGGYKGELVVAREDISLAGIDHTSIENLHVQMICRAERTARDGTVSTGIGVHEQLILGPYAPYGL